MKLSPPIQFASRAAFTLPELIVALTVFSFVVTGVIFAHLYGLSMFRITETSLSATASARKVASRITEEVRTCNSVLIGDVKTVGGTNKFVGLLNGEKQQGGGLIIYPSTNLSRYIVYFVNPADQTFRRTTDQPGSAMILAESVTNTLVFRAENYKGEVQTNNVNNRVIRFALEFYQPHRHMQVADYYKLESSVTRRAD